MKFWKKNWFNFSIVQHSVLQNLFNNANKFPEKKALIIDNDSLSFKELENEIIERASIFASLGVVEQEKLILLAEMNFDFVINYFASHFLGAVAVPVDKDSNEKLINNYKKILKTNFFFKGKISSV